VTRVEEKLDRLLPAALVTLFAPLFLTLRSSGLIINDEGWFLFPALRMLEGDLLYRDLFVYYAPLRFHVLQALFALTEPSLLAARSLWIGLLLMTVVGSYRIARRFAPPSIAVLPALAYGLAPGPWHKSPYGFCTVVFFLALARALERQTTARILVLGAVVGFTLLTRQDLGMVQAALAVGLVGIAPSLRSGLRCESVLGGVRDAARVLGVAVVTLSPAIAYYAAHGALREAYGAVVVQAIAYSDRPPVELLQLVNPRTLGLALEGPGVGALLLAPLLVYPFILASLWRAVRARPAGPRTLLGLALLAAALPALVQGYNPPLLVRYLQSALAFYLLVAWMLGGLEGRLQRAATGLAYAAVGAQSWAVIGGLPMVFPSDAFTGSLRMARYETPVRVLGDIVLTDESMAAEIRSVREFLEARAKPDEPIFAAPLHSLYWVLLERPNPTAFIGDVENTAMSVPRKQLEMDRLIASATRYAIADGEWWSAGPSPERPIVNALHRSFRPVRKVGSLVVLERRRRPLGSSWRRSTE
jgi:hypothetical protein